MKINSIDNILSLKPSKLLSYAKTITGALVLTIFLPFLFTCKGCASFDFTNTGQIGDTIGGTMGPFIAIGASILTFLAFWAQIEANKQQAHDISVERFENSLFQMISLQEQITNNLKYTYLRWNNDETCLSEGRAVFDYIYNIRKFEWHSGLRQSIEEKGYEIMAKDSSLGCLDHYFCHLYSMIKYIDEANIFAEDLESRYRYTYIVRSMLSEYELIFIFYNSLQNSNSSFKQLIERYALLKNLRIEHLANKEDINYYSTLVAEDIEKSESVSGSKDRYSHGAFKFTIQ